VPVALTDLFGFAADPIVHDSLRGTALARVVLVDLRELVGIAPDSFPINTGIVFVSFPFALVWPVNGKIAPKSILIEVADPISRRGRQNPRLRHGECPGMLPGFVPLACNRRISWEQGRAVRFEHDL
jgi:hypothetical protein